MHYACQGEANALKYNLCPSCSKAAFYAISTKSRCKRSVQEMSLASNAPDAASLEEEVAAIGVEAATEKAMTIFPRDKDGNPIMWDYQMKGYFKDTCGMLKRIPGTYSSKVKAYKKEIDGLVFVRPRQIPIKFSGKIGSCQRPLRAQTAQGDRVALANSETIPAGAVIEFEIVTMLDDYEKIVMEWLEYGQWRGLGQWRNSGKGVFLYDVLDADGKIIGGNNEFTKLKAV